MTKTIRFDKSNQNHFKPSNTCVADFSNQIKTISNLQEKNDLEPECRGRIMKKEGEEKMEKTQYYSMFGWFTRKFKMNEAHPPLDVMEVGILHHRD